MTVQQCDGAPSKRHSGKGDEPMGAGICSSCKADIMWARTSHGKRMPIDPEPRPEGNLAVYRDHMGQIRARTLGEGQEPETYERRAMPHFATCPNIDRDRKKTDGTPDNVVDIRTARRARA